MLAHLRSNLILLVGSLLIGSALYPAALWAIGQGLFPTKANGSLIAKADGTPVGSTQIAQAFTKDEYFWPRPSAASYNAAAAGGSNWGANNPKLRDRVAQQIGPLVRYKSGTPVGPDIDAWYQRELVAHRIEPAKPETVIAAAYFDAWLQDAANKARVAEIEPVPADFAMASGAGLDPHITVRNAKWQLSRVAAKRAVEPARIEAVVNELASAPLGGLAGEPLVNVLELNLELDKRFPTPTAP